MTPSTTELKLIAPAKLNLFLHICAQREDGFHELQSLFQFLDYGDELSFTANNSGQLNLSCDDASLSCDADNLIIRAAQALKYHVKNDELGADIHLRKRLPIGGGVGGGSSDAATTLLALNKLWRLELDLQTLSQLGLDLGADVPIFVMGHSAWAEGVGEHLTRVDIDEPYFLVAAPKCEVSTAEVFGHPQLRRDSPRVSLEDFRQGLCHNDCEPLVRLLYPEVDSLIERLQSFGDARMTGTGACVFVALDSEEAAQIALHSLGDEYQAFVARGRNISPCHIELNAGV